MDEPVSVWYKNSGPGLGTPQRTDSSYCGKPKWSDVGRISKSDLMQMRLRFLDPRFRGRYAHLIAVFRYGSSRYADALVLKLAENHLVRERGIRIFVLDDGGYPMLDATGREVFLPCRPLYLSMKKSTLGTAADILDCAWCRSFRAVLEGSGAGGLGPGPNYPLQPLPFTSA